jgi:DNA repair protein RecO (recombination protein O)
VKQLQTTGIVLSRTEFGEADRIVTMLTPNYGKLRLMARGVRKIKSKLAGGIELFSVSEVSFIRGKGEIGTLTSTRLIRHYGSIVKDIDRVQLTYALIKLLNRATEDEPGEEYFELLEKTFAAMNDHSVPNRLVEVWFQAQLLKLDGHTPNLETDTLGTKLSANTNYEFDIDAVAFFGKPEGHFTTDHIKTLRLIFGRNSPLALSRVEQVPELTSDLAPIIKLMRDIYIRSTLLQ